MSTPTPPHAERFQLDLSLHPQPTDTSCGHTCLHGVYHYFRDDIEIETILGEIPELKFGGTLAVNLGIHALKRGYKATLYTYNLRIVDPTWFIPKKVTDFRDRLAQQVEHRKDPKTRMAAESYLEFADLGGDIRYETLNGSLIRRILRREVPILTGLSSTFLYNTSRQVPEILTDHPDDLRGEPEGHFVVLYGYDKIEKRVHVADPWPKNPLSKDCRYHVEMDRLINAILLGVLTYDGNLLVIEPNPH